MEITIASVLADISSIGTAAVSWMSEVVGFITENPLVFVMCTAVFFIGASIGLVRRLIG